MVAGTYFYRHVGPKGPKATRGQALALRWIERSRGTGPRATVVGAFLWCQDREVSPTAGPRATVKTTVFFTKIFTKNAEIC